MGKICTSYIGTSIVYYTSLLTAHSCIVPVVQLHPFGTLSYSHLDEPKVFMDAKRALLAVSRFHSNHVPDNINSR